MVPQLQALQRHARSSKEHRAYEQKRRTAEKRPKTSEDEHRRPMRPGLTSMTKRELRFERLEERPLPLE